MFPNTATILELQSDLLNDLAYFLPELILCSAIVLMLFLRLFWAFKKLHLGWIALFALTASLFLVLDPLNLSGTVTDPDNIRIQFTGLLLADSFSYVLRTFLIIGTLLTTLLCLLTGIPDREDSADFFTLLLGATVGMMMMVSANHLLMVFLALEMASLPSYALAGFLKGRKQGSEAALKYVIYGAAASGMILYGISLLMIQFETGYLPLVGDRFSFWIQNSDTCLLIGIGLVLVLAGIAFKLSLVPFHFWCPDVFEGAASEVAAYLSVVSKAAAMGLVVRFLNSFAGSNAFASVSLQGTLGIGLAVIAGLTMTLGNLAALSQTNIKRMLAYSTIAHAGYMFMGLASLTQDGIAGMLFYLLIYLPANLGVFAIAAYVRNQTGSEEISAFRGLLKTSPWLAITMSLFLMSLLGLPPIAGFAGKFQLFAATYDASEKHRVHMEFLGDIYFGLLLLAGINTVISAVFYLNIMRLMILEDEPNHESEPAKRMSWKWAAYLLILALPTIGFGIFWQAATQQARDATQHFRFFKVFLMTEPNEPLRKGPATPPKNVAPE